MSKIQRISTSPRHSTSQRPSHGVLHPLILPAMAMVHSMQDDSSHLDESESKAHAGPRHRLQSHPCSSAGIVLAPPAEPVASARSQFGPV